MPLTGGTRKGSTRVPVPVSDRLDVSISLEPEDLVSMRRIMAQRLRGWGVSEESSDRMLLAVNELLTNVVEHVSPDAHGCRLADLLVQRVPDGVVAVVGDKDPRPIEPVAAAPLDESGRGLALVGALVDESEVSLTASGKDVRVFIADPAPATGS
ncbi:ATP-binding protein [Streptomyces sp. NPDC048636]|uniref:ATP-binding protein n=1 Tax=Streptomyces sp. NPDC048636 TaxID=3155762 RepID=UPI00341A9F66